MSSSEVSQIEVPASLRQAASAIAPQSFAAPPVTQTIRASLQPGGISSQVVHTSEDTASLFQAASVTTPPFAAPPVTQTIRASLQPGGIASQVVHTAIAQTSNETEAVGQPSIEPDATRPRSDVSASSSNSDRKAGPSTEPSHANRSVCVDAGTPTVSFRLQICPICCDRPKSAFIPGCGHSFCTVCIFHVAESSAKCPICRGPVTEVKELY